MLPLHALGKGAIMADEQVIKLLEEIRHLQKLHVENYKDALKNQQESIATQRQAMRRQRINLLVIGLVLVVFCFLAWSSYSPK
jgi:CHASE3 domain sensor protein